MGGDKGTVISGEQNLLVTVRIRPLTEDEILNGARVAVHKMQDQVVILLDPLEDPDDVLRANRSRERQFVFDCAMDGSATQEDVYQNTTKFLIDNVVKGYNATVFAYGATGAGKTYTMLGTDKEPGVMYRAMEDLFKEMERTAEDCTYKVSMSYLEIYNEQLRDLLNPSSGVLELREDSRGVAQVASLMEIQTNSTAEVMGLLTRGNMARTTEPTSANKTSSRSHAVLQITVMQRSRVPSVQEEVRTGKLFLIDLAGSERASNTDNRGKRMVEGAHINRSLLALGNCINALADRAGPRYINYRDSKLTRLLKDALGGNCKTVMIAHVSPFMAHFEESRNTLVYADRAKHIKTKVRRNVTDVSYHIAQYTNIISELRQEIFRLRNRLEESSLERAQGRGNKKAENDELNKMKEQLLSSFQEQMELRYKVMHLDSKCMDLDLTIYRNKLATFKWESEKALRMQAREEKTDDERLAAAEKEAELRGLEDIPDPEEVAAARDELKVLQEERQRTEKMKRSLERELEEHRAKAKKMEEVLPSKISSQDQKEILMLLCKVHELEIENTEMQSEAFLKEHEIRKRDMVITKLRNHRQLCDEIISQQRHLLDSNQIEYSKELEEMYDVYQQEINDPAIIASSSSMPDINAKTDYATDSAHDTRRFSSDADIGGDSSTPRHQKHEEKVFSLSSKSKHILEAKSREEQWNRSQRQVQEQQKPPQNKHEISSNTRNIAALAAQRRHRMHKENSNVTTTATEHLSYLTPSRLARHDNNYESMGNLRRFPSDDDVSLATGSVWTEAAAAAGTAGTSNSVPQRRRVVGVEKRRPQTLQLQPFEPRRGDLQNSTRTNKVSDPKLHKRIAPGGVKQSSKKKTVYAANGRVIKDKRPNVDDVREFDAMSLNSGTLVYQLAPDRGRGHALQKTSRTPAAFDQQQQPQYSPLGTPSGSGSRRTARKPPPTIPAYRKADIGVTGYSFAK